jgi:DNA-binding transcriptional ArsR family regulator
METSVDSTLAALADPTRRRVIEMLRIQPRPAGELASEFGMSAPAMSRHLRTLRVTGLVEEQRTDSKDARLRVYRLRRKPFAELQDWLAEVEQFWSEQLSEFKAHTERRSRRKRL